MKRRYFIKSTGISASVVAFSPSLHASPYNDVVTVNDLHHYLRSLHEIKSDSVDQIIIGNPDARITKIGTCWMPYWDILKEAVKAGVNTMITHEPTFYTNFDLKQIEKVLERYPAAAKKAYLEQIERKKNWIQDNNLSIIRCHDVLDILPETGIPYSFGKILGFSNEDIIRSEAFYKVYRIRETTAKDVAKKIASSLSVLGQQGVAFYGDERKMIRSVGLGTGAICDPIRFMHLEADLRIAIDDSVITWTQTYYAHDTGNPLIVVNHGTAEEYGIRTFSAYLKGVLKNIEIIHFNEGCGYKRIF